MAADIFDIQKLVNESGVPRRTIYFYVQQGLLPPPQGAGLAAFYTEDHLLRLRLIPLLRDTGLRLDDIRERFTRMSADEMRQQINEAAEHAAHKKAAVPQPAAPPAPLPRSVMEPPGFAPGWGGQKFTHYALPAGITLLVPEQLSPQDRQRFEQLLQAARRIFSGPNGQFIAEEKF
jgi:DNA-binding transcriptional MerR regulator